MKTKRWQKKKINSDWEQHQVASQLSFEKLGFEVIQEDTSGHQGVGKTAKGKCDLQVLNKDGTEYGYFECKRVTTSISMPQPGNANPVLKMHQMEFLKDMWFKGIKSGIIFKYVTDNEFHVIIMPYEKIMMMVAKYTKNRNGNLVLPSFTLKRLLEFGVVCPVIDDYYDFKGLVV